MSGLSYTIQWGLDFSNPIGVFKVVLVVVNYLIILYQIKQN